ncbi:hypothetical protein MKZ38_002792 [Zalerion maritima]|uniref:Uncharacterized protein n=1 Tax=Zalerion maritima TaxID=339359 RepID=A0AAD5RNE8_9PEZI|nr:hypothetical protein MKZ38_002792 [Zalerion maritima]
MADSAVRSSTTKEDKLSPFVTLIHPPSDAPPTSVSVGKAGAGAHSAPPEPKLIILAAWMAAQDAHIRKYTAVHHIMYPTAPILLLRCPLKNMVMPGTGKASILPAVSVVRKYVPVSSPGGLEKENREPGKQQPEVLVHMFSNGGSSTTAWLFDFLGEEEHGGCIPRYTAVLDSCPGKFQWARTYAALTAGLPNTLLARAIAWPVMQGVICGYVLRYFIIGGVRSMLSGLFRRREADSPNKPRGAPGPRAAPDEQNGSASAKNKSLFRADKVFSGRDTLSDRANAHNTPARMEAEVGGRTYIYGPGDAMIDWTEVERHAAAAASAGFDVKTERFEESGHVNHMRKDPDRYWGLVGQRWAGWWADRRQKGTCPESR